MYWLVVSFTELFVSLAGVRWSPVSTMRRDRQGSRLTFPRVPVPQPQLDDLDGDGWGFMSSFRVPASRSPASAGVKQVAPRPKSLLLPQHHLRGHAHTRSNNDLPSFTQRRQQQQQQQPQQQQWAFHGGSSYSRPNTTACDPSRHAQGHDRGYCCEEARLEDKLRRSFVCGRCNGPKVRCSSFV